MHKTLMSIATGVAVITTVAMQAAAQSQTAQFSWQSPHAKVSPKGDLEWAPAPFAAEKGREVRYIDFEKGSDNNDGRSTAKPWKHHPLDPAAEGVAKNGMDADTFIFKRGVTYRGTLRGKIVGTEERPVRLTSDPAWGGAGEAVFAASEHVTNWKLGADRGDIPEGAKVWVADIDFAPRSVWAVRAGGVVERVPLARTPNWSVTDPEDVMSNWFVWEQPEWWTGKNKTSVNGKKMHLGIDKKNLTGKAEDYVGGLVWSEWGIVMGTPYPTRIESFDAAQRGIGFEGFWLGDSAQIIAGNRYFVEDKPNFLDSPGEFWFDKKGAGGRLYIRLAGDANPNNAQVEAARHINIMDFTELRHARISGLSFRFSNVFWDVTARQFVNRDVEPAAIRLYGSGVDARVSHCRFEHVNKAIRFKAADDADTLDKIVVSDNYIAYTDHGAIDLAGSERWGKVDPPFAHFGDAKILRNKLLEIGRRAIRSDSSHAVFAGFPETIEVAGNMLDRTYGAGLFIFAGKPDGAKSDAPLSRALLHHNKANQTLLAANDWGGIETWQGGPFYVYNNISANPGGFWNWSWRDGAGVGNARLGFAYYLDGGFKNYHFNNIAWGADNDPASKYANRTAFYHAVPTVLNAFFNNTAYRFLEGSGWSPTGGRQLYLGNVWSDISKTVFLHGKQKEDEKASYDRYELDSIAYSRNIFEKVPEKIGSLEGTAPGVKTLDEFRRDAQAANLLASDIGALATAQVLADPAKFDFRPAPNSPAKGQGARFFVPWSLARTVGEWQFRRNNADPTLLLDEHWYMSPLVINREKYKDTPRHDLRAQNITAADYEPGALENWCASALRFTPARGTVLTLPPPASAAAAGASGASGASAGAAAGKTLTHTPADWLEIVTPAFITPGQETTIEVRIKKERPGMKLALHLHWLKTQGWGGFDTLEPNNNPAATIGTHRFKLKPGAHDELTDYSVLVGISDDGNWKDGIENVTARVPIGAPAPMLPARVPGPHDTDKGSFMIEAFFRADAGHTGGKLVSCIGDRGYELGISEEGSLYLTVKEEGRDITRSINGQTIENPDNIARIINSSHASNDGKWHHVIAEVDRSAFPEAKITIYIDGKKHFSITKPKMRGSLQHDGDLTIGANFAGSIDFLRIALSTLAESKTTIEELYAWQFDGPFLRDFTGRKPGAAGRAAGAVDSN